MYVLRQVLLGLGVFVGIAIKFAGLIIAVPAVPNLVLHGIEALGGKGAFSPFLTTQETAGLFALGLVVSGCGLGLMLYCFYQLGEGGVRAVMGAIFGAMALFLTYVQLSHDLTFEGRVIIGMIIIACVMIIAVVALPQQPRQSALPNPPHPRPLTRAERREWFRNSIIEGGEPQNDKHTYH